MTIFPDLFAALAAPFEAHEVKARETAGRKMHYITARTAMNRLDDVLGPENWSDEYVPHENSVLCRLTIKLPDGSALTKADAGGYAGMSDQGDDDKSGYSDSFKRAAVKFGVARYLYRDGVPSFARAAHGPGGAAAPARAAAQPTPQNGAGNGHPAPANGGGERKPYDGPPKSGKALFAWTKDQEQRYEVGLLKYLNQWAKLQDYPGRMIDWDETQVRLAYEEASRKLATVGAPDRGDAYEEALSNG